MDSDKNFQKAKDNLQPHNIFLKNTNCLTADNFEPNADWRNIVYQFFHLVRDSKLVSVISQDGEEKQFFKVYIDVGCRFIDSEDKKNRIQGSTQKLKLDFAANI